MKVNEHKRIGGGMKVNEHKRISGVGVEGWGTKVNEHNRIFWGRKHEGQ